MYFLGPSCSDILTFAMLQTDGGYLGLDFQTFFSAVVSGAPGVYVAALVEDAGIETDMVVRPGQRVSIGSDPSLPQPARWGGGDFTVQQRSSLTLRSVAVDSSLSVVGGGVAALIACSGRVNGMTVTDSGFSIDSVSTTTLGGTISLSNAGTVVLEDKVLDEGAQLMVGDGTMLSMRACGGQVTGLTVTDSSFSIDGASTTTLGGTISLSNAGSVVLEDKVFIEGAMLVLGGGTTLSLVQMAMRGELLHLILLNAAPGSSVQMTELSLRDSEGELRVVSGVAMVEANGISYLPPDFLPSVRNAPRPVCARHQLFCVREVDLKKRLAKKSHFLPLLNCCHCS